MVKVDKDTCIGCGFCFSNYDEVFTCGEDGLAEVKKEANLEEHQDEIKEAIAACPVGAIKED